MMRDQQILQYNKEILWNDLFECYTKMSKNKSIDLNSLIKSHKKLLIKSSLNGKNRDKTLKLLYFFINSYKNDKLMALQNFMNMLNNKNLLNNI